ncbi:MAG: hypothetical protein SF002_09525 [Alphaproteobacteria bacterium]|nr:hypothetical protein [Alphaproteobacteria bacterium]
MTRFRWTLLVAGCVSIATPLAAQAPATPSPYAAFTQTATVPFVNGARNFAFDLSVAVTVNGHRLTVPVDTGSTGMAVSASVIPGYDPNSEAAKQFPVGWEFLSSSKRLWVGRWVPVTVQFLDTAGAPVAEAKVPVLAVSQAGICTSYVEASSGPNCPGQTLPPAPSTIGYMGVGFGREQDGQSQGTPNHNALLNITQVGGQPVDAARFRLGYVVSSAGIGIGLTAANTAGFRGVQLQLRVAPPNTVQDKRDWQQAPVCIGINTLPCQMGAFLGDSGVASMYIDSTQSLANYTEQQKDANNQNLSVPVLKPGNSVTIQFGPQAAPVAWYRFTVGQQDQPMAPPQVIALSPRSANFVNSGRHLFRGFEVMFDAIGGVYGLKWTGQVPAAQGGMGAAPR